MTQSLGSSKKSAGYFVQPKNVPISEVHNNTSQEAIFITEDRLKLVLTTHLQSVEKKKSWIAPLSTLLTIITAFCTANFRDALGIPAHSWQTIFVISGIVSLIWLIYSSIQALKSPSLDNLIMKIKNKS